LSVEQSSAISNSQLECVCARRLSIAVAMYFDVLYEVIITDTRGEVMLLIACELIVN
jgi:hypothetical protein